MTPPVPNREPDLRSLDPVHTDESASAVTYYSTVQYNTTVPRWREEGSREFWASASCTLVHTYTLAYHRILIGTVIIIILQYSAVQCSAVHTPSYSELYLSAYSVCVCVCVCKHHPKTRMGFQIGREGKYCK